MFHRKSNESGSVDAVIIDEKRVSVSALKRDAKKANRRFWALAVSFSMIMMMILPYMSMAAVVASSDSDVFTGTVIPGYSMGGIELAAYGVDINSWGQVSTDTIVKSNYGVWSSSRGDAAKNAGNSLTGSSGNNSNANNYNMSGQDKSDGWKQMTGRSAYSWDNPNGEDKTTQSNQYDYVAPYRSPADVNFWNKKEVSSGDNASASVTVDLCADFIIVGVDENGCGCVIQSPDDATNLKGERTDLLSGAADHNAGTRGGFSGSTAIPYYVPLSALFDNYGITDASGANITNLMSEMARQDADGKKLGDIARKNNLLEYTSYRALNSENDNPNGGNDNKSKGSFNPYPYTMVFTTQSDSGSTVISSMYGNDEAYVYFSPSSVYSKYMTLKAEYENIKASSTQDIAKNDSVKTFQLGYYAASMAILEAYLEEALPQDMTRGYVGASESESTKIYKTNPGEGKLNNFSATNSSDIKKVTFSSLMYDVAANNRDSLEITEEGGNGTTHSETKRTGAMEWLQPETNAIMDTLSVFGYSNGNGSTHLGVMQGLNARQTQERLTSLTPYTTSRKDGKGNIVDINKNAETKYAGVYTPTYFPVQQQLMPSSEKAYRFQILTSVPYDTLTSYIKNYGFSNGVTLSYSSDQIDNVTFSDYADGQDKLASLAAQYNDMSENGDGSQDLYLVNVIDGSTSTASPKAKHDMISIYGNEGNSGSDTTSKFVETAGRVDSALLGYNASNMSSDNVHDLLDVVRATCNLKYDTWFRYYNPIKSEGGDTDLFVTRVSPAKTTYFPSILTRGYVCAGGVEATGTGSNGSTSATTIGSQYDFFSIPSFAPCFASHTASDCYYGVLNYELRAFYSKGFLSVLSDGTGLPALEQYESAMDDAKSASDTEQTITWQNLAMLYVMGKRLAYIKAMQTVAGGGQSFTLDNIINKMAGKYNWGKDDWNTIKNEIWDTVKEHKWYRAILTNRSVTGSVLVGAIGDDLEKIGSCTINSEVLKDSVKFSKDGMAFKQSDSGNWGTLAANNDANPFKGDVSGVTGRLPGLTGESFSGGIDFDDPVDLVDSNKKSRIGVSGSFLLTMVYDDIFDSYFEKGGKYYWVPWEQIASQIENKGINVQVEDGGKFFGKDEGNEWEKYSIGFHTEISNAKVSTVVDDYEKKIEEAAKEISTAVNNLAQDINLMASSMPNQMQNCLAWADYQNSSDSEGQYQTDPSDANVTVNVSTQVSTNDSDKVYLGAKDAQAAGVNVANGDDENPIKLSASGATDSDSNSMKAKMTRGVEGATWTSTGTPAGYTMSATIARVDSLAANSGTTYPYSGIANGRLLSGTDQYALLQSHVIDYSSISSGIAGDLATRQRANLVKISNPEYTSITDFLSNLGNIGALCGEAGRSMINGASDLFSSMFFVKDVNTSSQANVNDASKTNTGASNGKAATFINYTTSSGITMNRLPASANTFNVQSGKLESNGSMISTNNGYISQASSANADSSTGSRTSLTSNMSVILLQGGSSFYALLQTLGLTLVMVFIGYIAFRNLYAYAILNNHKMVQAQMQLKTVLPRSVIAIFMIGLPPIGNGMGFEGGNFILLDLINNLVSFIAQIFVNLSSSALMSVMTALPDPSGAIVAYIGYFVACLIISLCFIAGCIMIVIQQLILVAFYIIGPIAWSMYVWPYSAVDENILRGSKGNRAKGEENNYGEYSFADQVTARFMNLKFFTNNRAGDIAPKALVTQYALIASLTIMWGLIFWIVAMVFTTLATAPLGDSGSNAASAASLTLASTGYPTASASITDFFTAAEGTLSGLSMLLSTIICVILFALMGKLMIDMIKKQTGYNQSALATLGRSIKEGITMSNTIGGIAESGASPADEIRRMKNSKNVVERAKGNMLETKLSNHGGVNKNTVEALAKKSARNKAISNGVSALAHGATAKSVASDVKRALNEGSMKAQTAENKEKKALNDATISNIDDLNKLNDPKAITDFVNSLSAGDRKKLENLGVITENADGTFSKANRNVLDNAKKALVAENTALADRDADVIRKANKQAEKAKKIDAKNEALNPGNANVKKSLEEMNNALGDVEKYGRNGLAERAAEERMKIADYERENKDFSAEGYMLGVPKGKMSRKALRDAANGRAAVLSSMESHAEVSKAKKALISSEEKDVTKQLDNVVGTANALASHYENVAKEAGLDIKIPSGRKALRSQFIAENMTDILTDNEFALLNAKCGRGELTAREQQRLSVTKALYDISGIKEPDFSSIPFNSNGLITGTNYQISELVSKNKEATKALCAESQRDFGMSETRISKSFDGNNIIDISAGKANAKLDDVIDASGKTVRQHLIDKLSDNSNPDSVNASEQLVNALANNKNITLGELCEAYNRAKNLDFASMQKKITDNGGTVDLKELRDVLKHAAYDISNANECAVTIEHTQAALNHNAILGTLARSTNSATMQAYADSVKQMELSQNASAAFEKLMKGSKYKDIGTIKNEIASLPTNAEFTVDDKKQLYNAALIAYENPTKDILETLKPALATAGISSNDVDDFYTHDFNVDARKVGELVDGRNSLLAMSGNFEIASCLAATLKDRSDKLGINPPNVTDVKACIRALQTGVTGEDAFINLKEIKPQFDKACSVFTDKKALSKVKHGTSSDDLQEMGKIVAINNAAKLPDAQIYSLLIANRYSHDKALDYIEFQKAIPSGIATDQFDTFCELSQEAYDNGKLFSSLGAATQSEIKQMGRREAAQRGKALTDTRTKAIAAANKAKHEAKPVS